MNAIEALTQRNSIAALTGPDITSEQLDVMIQAALRAADHGWLKPSRFIAVRGEQRNKLGQVFLETKEGWQEMSETEQYKLLNSPTRAPLLLISVCSMKDHSKIPKIEQLHSTAASTQNIINAAWALGLGAMWRTGSPAHNEKVAQALGLTENEQIIGFIYVGHRNQQPKPLPILNTEDFLTELKL